MDYRRRATLAALIVCAAFLVLVLSAPFMAPYGSFRGLDGSPGFIEGGWRGHGVAGIAYAVGDLMCHQQEARSFMLNGSQLPICMRDTGIAIGLVIGFAACLFLDRRLRDRRFAIAGAILVLLMGAEWAVETTGFNSPFLRTTSGICAGIGATMFLCWMLHRDPPEE